MPCLKGGIYTGAPSCEHYGAIIAGIDIEQLPVNLPADGVRAIFERSRLPAARFLRLLEVLRRRCNISPCESGGIGRRTRLRIWRGNPWGFESPLSHQSLIRIPKL